MNEKTDKNGQKNGQMGVKTDTQKRTNVRFLSDTCPFFSDTTFKKRTKGLKNGQNANKKRKTDIHTPPIYIGGGMSVFVRSAVLEGVCLFLVFCLLFMLGCDIVSTSTERQTVGMTYTSQEAFINPGKRVLS
jgi:hypothetical protein